MENKNLQQIIGSNINASEVENWIEEIAPIDDNAWFQDGSLSMMRFKYNGRIFDVQLKVTKNEEDFLDNPRINLTQQ